MNRITRTVFFVFTSLSPFAVNANERVVSVGDSCVNFRTSPYRYSEEIDCLPTGTSVKVLGQSQRYTKVEIDGEVGYVYGRYLKDAPVTIPAAVIPPVPVQAPSVPVAAPAAASGEKPGYTPAAQAATPLAPLPNLSAYTPPVQADPTAQMFQNALASFAKSKLLPDALLRSLAGTDQKTDQKADSPTPMDLAPRVQNDSPPTPAPAVPVTTVQAPAAPAAADAPTPVENPNRQIETPSTPEVLAQVTTSAGDRVPQAQTPDMPELPERKPITAGTAPAATSTTGDERADATAQPQVVEEPKTMLATGKSVSLAHGRALTWNGCNKDALIQGGMGRKCTPKEFLHASMVKHMNDNFLGCVKQAANKAGYAEPAKVYIDHMGCYQNRSTASGGISNHAYARAIDIGGMVLLDKEGKKIANMSSHVRHYKGQNKAFYDEFRACWKASLPKSCKRQKGSIGISHSKLGGNGDHADHIHLEFPRQCG